MTQCGIQGCEFFGNTERNGVLVCSWHFADMTAEIFAISQKQRRISAENSAIALFKKSGLTIVPIRTILSSSPNSHLFTTTNEILQHTRNPAILYNMCPHILDYWNITADTFGGLAECHYGHGGAIPTNWIHYKQALDDNKHFTV